MKEQSLADALKYRRGELTLIEASASSGISLGSYHRLEAGGQPDRSNFVKAMQWIGVPRKEWWRYMKEMTV